MAPALSHSLHELVPFPVGTVIKWPQVASHGAYNTLARSQFNSFTPENAFKTSALRPARDRFTWDDADAFVDFALSLNKKVHGHTLLWDHAIPEWIQKTETPDEEILESHVRQITNRYKGRIRGWDVVNEAFDEDGNLRKGIWHRIGGEQYIGKAFTIAHAADPDALLFYNDFDLEINDTKRKAVISYLNKLKDMGVPVHGIGLQLHLNISSVNVSSLEKALNEIAGAGYLVHLSELDISVNPYNGVISGKEELFQAQAKLLWLVFEKYLQIPPDQRYGVTFWGIGDADSWLTSDLKHVDYPLLFDSDYQPKPAWFTLVDMFTRLKDKWNGHWNRPLVPTCFDPTLISEINCNNMDIKKLQYPVGAFEFPSETTAEKRNSWIVEIASFPSQVRDSIAQLRAEQLLQAYRPGGWTIIQVVNHCADSHMNALIRFKLALTEENPTIKPYAEDRWGSLPDGTMHDLTPSLQIIEGVHRRWVHLMKSMEGEQWSRTFFHPEKNSKLTLDQACAMYAWHCRHHLAHIALASKGLN